MSYPYETEYDMHPGEWRTVTYGKQEFLVVALEERAVNSGRQRYTVACLDCDNLVHQGSTSPSSQFKYHKCR